MYVPNRYTTSSFMLLLILDVCHVLQLTSNRDKSWVVSSDRLVLQKSLICLLSTTKKRLLSKNLNKQKKETFICLLINYQKSTHLYTTFQILQLFG